MLFLLYVTLLPTTGSYILGYLLVLFESAEFLFPLIEQRARVHSLVAAPSGIAAAAGLLLFRGTVCIVRRTLAQSAFHGFSVGFQRGKKRVDLIDL